MVQNNLIMSVQKGCENNVGGLIIVCTFLRFFSVKQDYKKIQKAKTMLFSVISILGIRTLYKNSLTYITHPR